MVIPRVREGVVGQEGREKKNNTPTQVAARRGVVVSDEPVGTRKSPGAGTFPWFCCC